MTDLRFPRVLVDRQEYGDNFEKDCIFTHPEAIISLGKYGILDRSKSYVEPACGIGNLSIVLNRNGYGVDSFDRLDWQYGSVLDIKDQPDKSYDVVITNPPYSIWEPFLKHCLRIAKTDVFLLLPTRYLEGQHRSQVLKATGLTEVLIFAYRLKMYNTEGKQLSGMTSYSWFHWVQSKRVFGTMMPTTLDWLYR